MIAPKTYNDKFKKQMVQPYNAGKIRAEILRKYNVFFDKLVKRINATNGSTPEEIIDVCMAPRNQSSSF